MLGAGNPATGTAGYVAIEQVTGALHGRAAHSPCSKSEQWSTTSSNSPSKSFLAPALAISPASPETMTIKIVSGKHSYQFDYTLPVPPNNCRPRFVR